MWRWAPARAWASAPRGCRRSRSPRCMARRPISRSRCWRARKLSQQQGWGPDGIQVLPLGAVPARLAAMERNELDGMVIEAATSYELEEQGKGRTITLFGDIEKHFYTHVIYATDEMIEKRPELLRRFLRGWFKTVAFMRANKEAAVKSGAKVVEVRESIVSKVYDTQIGGFSS